jgi:hypothetical protein
LPDKDRDLRVKASFDAAGQPVKLHVEGLPARLRDYQMCECTVSATSRSQEDIAIKPGHWFDLRTEKAGYHLTWQPPDKRTILKPGETVSQTVRLYLHGDDEKVTLQWVFVPDLDQGSSGTPR